MTFSIKPIVIVFLLTSIFSYRSDVGHGLRQVFLGCFGEGFLPGNDFIIKLDEVEVVILV